MSSKAIMFGAGNIGRGFIGQLFSESGYEVTFVDIDQELIEALNRQGSYRLDAVFNADVEQYRIGPVRAIHGSHADAVEAAVAEAHIGATAVGANALKFVAPRIAAGVARRAEADAPPLNIIVCENLKDAAEVLRDLVRENLDERLHPYLAQQVGFVNTVIGRMVPIPTPEMRAADVSLIRVEPYKELPVERQGFVGQIPDIVAMCVESSFPVFTARKLYIHNCGHALLAYLGYLRGHHFGYEALEDPSVRMVLDAGLRESIEGIVARYGAQREWLEEHVRDLMKRFANRALGDTIFRLGRDPARKLSSTDRLVGAAELANSTGNAPLNLAQGIAAGLLFDPPDDPAAQQLQQCIEKQGIGPTLEQISGIKPASQLGQAVLNAYNTLKAASGAA